MLAEISENRALPQKKQKIPCMLAWNRRERGMKKNHLEELDICRAIAALSVLVIHITSFPVTVMDKKSLLFQLIFGLNRALQYSVPLFLVMSALVEAYSLKNKGKIEFKGFYVKKTKRVLLPYLSWSVIYMGFQLLMTRFSYFGQMNEPQELLDIFLWGRAYYHLYFMIILIQLYLFLPILFRAQNTNRLRLLPALLLSYTLQLAFYYGVGKWIFPYFPDIVMTFPWYFFLLNGGFLLGLFYEQKEKLWRRYRFLLGTLLLISMAYYLWKCFRFEYVPREAIGLYMPSWYLYSFCISLLLLGLSAWLVRCGGWGIRLLKLIGRYSYGIYLVHPLILELHRKGLERFPVPSSVWYVFQLIALTVSVLLFSLGLSKLLSKARGLSWLVGE